MIRNIAAIAVILGATSAAWVLLGNTLQSRTEESTGKLRQGVESNWGSPQQQSPPVATYAAIGAAETRLQPESSSINVAFDLDYRQKGLLWYSTYAVDFSGVYDFRNTTNEEHPVTYRMLFPAEHAVYDDAAVEIDGKPAPFAADTKGISAAAMLPPGAMARVRVAYRSHGLESWKYRFGNEIAQAHNFTLVMKTNFDAVDFPPDTLSPTYKARAGAGWQLTWRYNNLIAGGYQIGMNMPEKLQPGPIAGQITYFAPVSLLTFFFLMFIITTMRNIELHPMNYFFLATAFFSFHLLLAYLVDHISIHLAFVICSAVSIFLVISYLRLVTGLRFAIVEAGIAQLVYLVLFSYSFFIQGFAGLTAATGCVVTLFVVMQMTGRIRWASKFAAIDTYSVDSGSIGDRR